MRILTACHGQSLTTHTGMKEAWVHNGRADGSEGRPIVSVR